MISLLQEIKKHKTISMIVAFVICSYIALTMTGFLAANASDNDNVSYSFARITESATNYLDHSNVPHEGEGTHILSSGYTKACNAGGILGAADTQKQAYIGNVSSAGDTYVISYSYDVLDNLYNKMDKDKGTKSDETKGALAYARYGYLLSSLGMDETTDATQNSGLRMIIGIAFMVMYLLSLGVNGFFELILTVLQYANPFRLFVKGVNAVTPGFMTDIATPDSTGSMSYAVQQGVVQLMKDLKVFYVHIYNMSFFVVMPVFLALTIFGITVLNGKKSFITGETSTFGKIKAWVVRIMFVTFGVPIMFSCYSATIDYLKDVTATSNAAGTKIIASTFLDFSTWATHDRLGLPTGDGKSVTLALDVKDDSISRNGKSGQPHSETSGNVRKYTYNINRQSRAISNLTENYGIIDFGSNVSKGNYDTNNMEKTDNNMESYDTVADVMSLLSRYAKGQTITASSFESAEAGRYGSSSKADSLAWQQMMADSQTYENFGPLAKQQDAVKPTADDEDENDGGTDNDNDNNDGDDNDNNDDDDGGNNNDDDNQEEEKDADYAYSPDVLSASNPTWGEEDAEATDAQKIAFVRFTVADAWKNGAEGADTGKIAVNPWANGNLKMTAPNIYEEHYGGKKVIKYHGGANPSAKDYEGNMVLDDDVGNECYGLSTMAMYNYLCSEFNAEGVNVHYMGKTGQKDFAHYQVVNVGTGAVKWLYLVDALVLMSCLSIVGYFYGLALMIHNFKAIFKIIPSVFTGMLGSLRGIAKSIALMFALIIEVVATVLLYYIATEFVAHITMIIELPFTMLISSKIGVDNASLQALLSPVILIIGIVAMVGITKKLIDWRQVIVNSTSGYVTQLINKVFGTDIQAPDLSQKSTGFGQRALTVAGGAAVMGMASGGLSGAGSLAEKLGIGGAEGVGSTADGVGEFGERVGDTVNNMSDGSTTTQYSDGYDPSQTYGGNTNTTVGDTNSDLDAYGGDTMNGDNQMYEGNEDAYMQSDNTEGDSFTDMNRDENSFQNANKYVDENADFKTLLHNNTDALNQSDQYTNSNNSNNNAMNSQVDTNTKQAIQDINQSELTAQGNNVIDTLNNIGDYAYSNDENIKTQAAANLKNNYGDAKAIHDNYNNQRANVMTNGAPGSAMQGDPRYQSPDSDTNVSAMKGDPRYQANTGTDADGKTPSNVKPQGGGDPRLAMNKKPETNAKDVASTKVKPDRKINTSSAMKGDPRYQVNKGNKTAKTTPSNVNTDATKLTDSTVQKVNKMAAGGDSPKKVNVQKTKTTGGYTQSTAKRPSAVPLYVGLTAMNNRDRRTPKNDNDSNS